MLKSYLIIAFRKLKRQKAFAVINIVGLSIGLTGALLIYMYVRHELSHDRFHEKADRIFRVYHAHADPGEAADRDSGTPEILAPTLQQEVPEIEEVVRIYPLSDFRTVVIQYEHQVYNETNVYVSDSGFSRMFTTNFLVGNPVTALVQPRAVVLSESTATKYFGNATEAMGKTLNITLFEEEEAYQVTGVTEDFPAHSHLHFNMLLSIDYSQETYHPLNWLSHWPYTYVLVPENTNLRSLEATIRQVTEKVLNPVYEQRFGKSYDQHKQMGGMQEYRLQPLTDIHLYSADMFDSATRGNILYVYLFIAIGIMLLCIASFNYINLSTAQAARGAKAAGVRKVLGAIKSQLYALFLTESVGIVLLASCMAITLAQVLLALDQSFLTRFIPYHSPSAEAIILTVILALLMGIVSGLVPARMISAFQPTQVLKGQLAQGKKGNRLRQVLVMAQFTISIGLIICTLLISQQLTYMQSKALGFNQEHLLVLKNVDKLGNRKQTLKQVISNENFVTHAALCYNTLGEPHNHASFTPVEMIEQGQRETVGIPVYIGDQDYLKTLGVALIMGHPFPENLAKENQQIILNQEALRTIGWQNREEAALIGKIIDVNGLKYELAGIVEDYHFRSLREKIGPMAIFSHYYNDYEKLLVRIKPGTYQQAIQSIQEHWQQLASDVPFDYSFVDEDLDRLYQSEQNLAALFRSFAGLTIFIACLGLLGLAMFTTERRVKEIGVRKVFGATVQNIVFLLSQDIVKLIALSLLVASPLAYFAMQHWLENFAYKIEIGWPIFLLAGGLTISIALLTMSLQTVKAAMTNPADSLKHE